MTCPTPPTSDQLLEQIRGERGYALSYHELLARTDPRLLEAYRELYARFTLEPRHLDTRRKELIWTGLLAAADEHVGSIHLERARDAGVSVEELRAAARLGGVAASWGAIAFAAEHWAHLLDAPSAFDEYWTVVDGAREPLDEVDASLLLLTVSGARLCEPQFVSHLSRLYELGVDERQVAEAVSYLLLPMGANTLLWATDRWFDAMSSGTITAGDVLRTVSFGVRRT